MGEVVNLTVISTAAGNKVLTPNEDGYYKVTLGAYNVRNSAGDIYSFTGVREVLNDKTNIFNRRLLAGRLRAEAEHPELIPGMTDEQYVMRNLKIDTTRSCGHIKEVTIKETNLSEGIPGIGNVVLVEGLIKPSGVFGEGLKSSLDNPDEDTCFSIRCFTKDVPMGIHFVKYIKQIVTWDWINDPGIKYASKLGAPAIEAHDLHKYALDNIEVVNSVARATGCSTESREAQDMLTELVDACNNTDIMSKW